MSIVIGLVFFAILIFASYKVGNRSAGVGIALFCVGTIVYSIFANGPESLFIGEECSRYSSIADDC